MLPALLAALGVGVGVLFSEAGRQVGRDLEDEVNDVNKKIEALAAEGKNKVDETEIRYYKALGKLNRQRKSIFKTTIANFAETAEKIKNVEFEKTIPLAEKVKGIDPKLYKNDSHYVHTFLTGKAGVIVGGIALHFINYMKLDRLKEEAEANYSKTKARYELLSRECVKIDSLTALCGTAYETIETLRSIADMAVEEMGRTLSQNGSDYLEYSEDEQRKIYLTFSVVGALGKLCSMQILTENGEVQPEFERFVGEVKANYLEGGSEDE